MDSHPNETHEMLKALKEDLASRHESAMKAMEDRDKRGSAIKIVLPIILSAALGLLVWYFENKIQTQATENNRSIQGKVEENNRLLSTRLALTEEFYKRKLDAYEKTCTQIARLEESLERYDGLELNPEVGAQATDSMNAVDHLSKSDFLYLSPKFKDQLSDLWQMGVDRMSTSGGDNADTRKKLSAQIKILRDEMNADLHTSDLNWLPQQSER
jgi:hypothetical protein